MRPYRWLVALFILATLFAVAPASAQGPRNNILTIDATDEDVAPSNLLSEEEVAKIERLQSEGQFIVPFSPVSPDDQAVLVLSTEEIGFLNINDGSSNVIDIDSFGPLLPLALVGQTNFNWVNERILAGIALNFAARNEDEAFVIVLIDRITLEIGAVPLRFPADTAVAAIGPDFLHYLLVTLPNDQTGDPSETASFQVAPPTPSLTRQNPIPLPAAYQRRVDQALRDHGTKLRRFQLLQDQQETRDGNLELTIRPLDLLRYNAATGEIGYVTTIPETTGILGEAWTDDASKVALSLFSFYEFDRPRPGFDGALLSEIFYRDATGNIPPAQNPLLQGNNTYVVDMAGGDVKILRPEVGAAPPILAAQDWSPDNQTIMVQAWYPARLAGRTHPIYLFQFSERIVYRFYNAADLRLTGSFGPNIFAAGAFSSPVGEMVSPDEVIFRGHEGTNRHVYYYNRGSGEFRNLADRAGSYYNVFPTNRTRQIVFAHTSFTNPYEIYRKGWDGKGLARLTWLNEELRQFANLREDPVSFRLANGQVRVGTLIQSADAPFPPRNTRIIVWQEGGPGVAMNGQWLTNVENPYGLLPSFGFALLVMPVAGRPGYSPAEFNALADRGNFGQIDIDEQAEVVRQMIRGGWTSAGKVGIVGCSYGGYFTWQSIIRHPDLYSAANPQCALVDAITEWARGFDSLMPYLQGLPPYNNLTEYRADSPVYNAARVKTPVLTFHGTNDFLPIVQNENLHLQLFNRGVPARMIRFQNEGHGLGEAENQLYAAQEQIRWFRTYLK